jgi:hypothetical protein
MKKGSRCKLPNSITNNEKQIGHNVSFILQ